MTAYKYRLDTRLSLYPWDHSMGALQPSTAEVLLGCSVAFFTHGEPLVPVVRDDAPHHGQGNSSSMFAGVALVKRLWAKHVPVPLPS
jgi:hypothetical protein